MLFEACAAIKSVFGVDDFPGVAAAPVSIPGDIWREALLILKPSVSDACEEFLIVVELILAVMSAKGKVVMTESLKGVVRARDQ